MWVHWYEPARGNYIPITVISTSKVWSCYGQWIRRCITNKIHYLTLTPRSRGPRSHKLLPRTIDIMWHMHQLSMMLLHPMVQEKMYLQENTFNYLTLTFGSRSHKMLPSTLYIIRPCSNGVWSYYVKGCRRRCIYKGIQYLTFDLDLGVNEMFPSTLYIMWPIQLQSLKLLPLMVKEEIHLQETWRMDGRILPEVQYTTRNSQNLTPQCMHPRF